ncbi:MAG: outer membrane lipoprotein-sorting protein [Phycisphaerales bacterium]|nr:hypothetical protein [Planctomycetota bacterium]MCH8508459.1 outer membrane lipoprotein-sorting protein [Phycisphaerales bacterium]
MKRNALGLIAALTATAGIGAAAAAQSLSVQATNGGLTFTLSFAGAVALEDKKHDEKALKVIDAYVEKIGGKDFIMSIQSMHTKGTISIPMAGMTGQMEMYAAQPGRMAMTFELPGFGKSETGYDGEYAWSSDPMSGPRLMTENELVDLREQADPNSAAKHRELYTVIEHAGEVDFHGQKAHKIRLVGKSERESFEFYSVESGMLIGQESVQSSPMGDLKVVTQLSDYKDFDGFKMPTRMIQNIGPQQIVMSISDVTLNKVDEKVFARPAAVQALIDAQKEG